MGWIVWMGVFYIWFWVKGVEELIRFIGGEDRKGSVGFLGYVMF